MTEIETKALELLAKLEAALPQVGSAAWDAAMWAARTKALDKLMSAAAGAALLAAALYGFHRVWPCLKQDPKAENSDAPFFVAIILGLATLIGACVFAVNAFDAWAWVGLFKPEVFMAKKALGL